MAMFECHACGERFQYHPYGPGPWDGMFTQRLAYWICPTCAADVEWTHLYCGDPTAVRDDVVLQPFRGPAIAAFRYPRGMLDGEWREGRPRLWEMTPEYKTQFELIRSAPSRWRCVAEAMAGRMPPVTPWLRLHREGARWIASWPDPDGRTVRVDKLTAWFRERGGHGPPPDVARVLERLWKTAQGRSGEGWSGEGPLVTIDGDDFLAPAMVDPEVAPPVAAQRARLIPLLDWSPPERRCESCGGAVVFKPSFESRVCGWSIYRAATAWRCTRCARAIKADYLDGSFWPVVDIDGGRWAKLTPGHGGEGRDVLARIPDGLRWRDGGRP